MAFFKLDCLGGQAEILAFSDTFSKYKELLKNDQVVFISGKPTDESEFSELKLIADEIVSIDMAREIFSKNINILIDLNNQNSVEDIDRLRNISEKYKGDCGLMFHFKQTTGRNQRVYAHNIKVATDNDFLQECRRIFGKEKVWVSD
tara:strand:- start:65 stop:505 length:441 start_codon:yes stop_codon:yes gene_type:complete